MARSAAMADLFGDVPQPAPARAAAGSPEADEPARAEPEGRFLYPPVPPGGHSAATIRPILVGIIAEARALATLDWDDRKLRSYTAMAPYYAEWLKHGEGDGLLREFKAEMDRLEAPADRVAPNWREMWGLAG